MKLRAQDIAVAQELLGYLNFSGGRPDPAFQRGLSELCQRVTWHKVGPALLQVLGALEESVPAFRNSEQARHVISLVLDRLWPAYLAFHSDLLFHLKPTDQEFPFLMARLFEAVLQQGPPWTDDGGTVDGALGRLNDFLGYRPVAVLENGRRSEPYAHERFRPIPLYLRGAGVSAGPYQPIIERAIGLLEQTPEDILQDAHFSLDQLDELALDVRAHDHLHPANRRTNYLFGEWDPHQIDLKGRYRRFVLRKVILDALLEWMGEQKRTAPEEILYDASAVLCGTILMASSISGGGPEAHDSTITLTQLLPKVARQRDLFYARLLDTATGARAKRLQRHAKSTQQPFGHVRQHLNLHLAQYGAQQVQRRHLAYLYARMGYADEAREQAQVIPCASARFECEIQWRVTAVRLAVEKHEVERAATLLIEAEDHLHRGIQCGAIVDPWNILGFQGQFPLFHSSEDSVPDQRIEVLLELVQELLEAYGRTLAEAAATGNLSLVEAVDARFANFAQFWDQHASTAVTDLPAVNGSEALESARRVASALGEWRRAGAAAGQISFWREHVAHFRSTKSYSQVVGALLERRDLVAALGLLMQWLSEAEEIGLEAPGLTFEMLMVRWMDLACVAESGLPAAERWGLVQRMFEVLEANAGELWQPPGLRGAVAENSGSGSTWFDTSRGAGPAQDRPSDDETDDEDNVFSAAYEGVVYRDSTDDGQEGEVADDGPRGDTPFELVERRIEPRLRFLHTLARLWQQAAVYFATGVQNGARGNALASSSDATTLIQWRDQAEVLQRSLTNLMDEVSREPIGEPSGDQDSNIEFDIQMQTKVAVLQQVITTIVACRVAVWLLRASSGEQKEVASTDVDEHRLVMVCRAILAGDASAVQKALPALLRSLRKKPLLYVPLDHGGEPSQMLAARVVQAILRTLIGHLPRLGLLRETWHLLQTARLMERTSRPQGLAVTEFDRLFRLALRRSLEAVVDASAEWKSGRFNDEELVELVGAVVEFYLEVWLEHSSTMRLSSVEALKSQEVWDEICEFIRTYGSDVLQARVLTLGNVRSILHQGVDRFLSRLAEQDDPLHPNKLLQDIQDQVIDVDDATERLQLIYQIVVEKFDRFLEYNSTTTQSDYGELFYCLLDFLRVEVSYDRDAWNFLPLVIAHEMLARRQRTAAAVIWEDVFEVKTEPFAETHLEDLKKLQKQYGMRLLGVTSHLEERFVRPLEVNHMLALVKPACQAARTSSSGEEFERLASAVEKYLSHTIGSGLEVPAWLRLLEDEIGECLEQARALPREFDPVIPLAPSPLSLRELRQQLRQWKDGLSGRGRPSA